MLNIKPILGFNDGEVVATERCVPKRALSVIIRRFKERQIDLVPVPWDCSLVLVSLEFLLRVEKATAKNYY